MAVLLAIRPGGGPSGPGVPTIGTTITIDSVITSLGLTFYAKPRPLGFAAVLD